MPGITQTQLRTELLKALKTLYCRDRSLIENNTNERSITARLCTYLFLQTVHNPDYAGLEWDHEYNRDGPNIKRIAESEFYPDIILHKRGASLNICVLEFKKEGRDDTGDMTKLRELTDRHGPYKYRYGTSIILKRNSVSMKWFHGGNHKSELDRDYPCLFSPALRQTKKEIDSALCGNERLSSTSERR